MYAYNELLFPPDTIPLLRQTRGEEWRALVDRVTSLADDDPESMAFSLLMVRLNCCMACETDSYRAMRGCTSCARQTLHRFKGSDADLLERYEEALMDLREYLEPQPESARSPVKVSARAA
jgi:hypothetical protein